MTSISRTAYPRFTTTHLNNNHQEWSAFTPTQAEKVLIQQWNRGQPLQLGFAVQLKVFQWLGYFPEIDTIPTTIVAHIRSNLPFIDDDTPLEYTHKTTLYRHRQKIREHLKITRWGKQTTTHHSQPINLARQHAISAALNAALTLNYPADIINVVIEKLRRASFELVLSQNGQIRQFGKI